MKKFRVAIGVFIMVALVVGYWMYLSNRDTATPAEQQTEVSDIGKLAARNLDTDYPNTPRKVVDFYSQITKSLYSEELSEQELQKLCEQSMKLFDAELLNANPEETFLDNTKAAIEEYRKIERIVTDYTLEASSDVDYYTEGGQEYAALSVKYFLRDKDGYGKTYEDFLLRKDEDGRWKIVGWQMTPASEKDSDE